MHATVDAREGGAGVRFDVDKGSRPADSTERLISTGGGGEFPVTAENVNPPVHKCGTSHKPGGVSGDSGVIRRENPLPLSFV